MENVSNTSRSGTEWTVRARYETTDGDRVTFLYLTDPEGDRFAVSYSYAWPDAPRFIECADRQKALQAFATSLEDAFRRGVVAHGEG